MLYQCIFTKTFPFLPNKTILPYYSPEKQLPKDSCFLFWIVCAAGKQNQKITVPFIRNKEKEGFYGIKAIADRFNAGISIEMEKAKNENQV
jgi:hypothetical protein